jgi:hypothetical protein
MDHEHWLLDYVGPCFCPLLVTFGALMGIPVPFRSLYSDNHAAQEVAIKPRSVHGPLPRPAFASVKLQAGHHDHLPGFPGPSHWGLSLSFSDSLSGLQVHLTLDDSESHASAHSDRDNRAVRAWPVAAGAGPGAFGVRRSQARSLAENARFAQAQA